MAPTTDLPQEILQMIMIEHFYYKINNMFDLEPADFNIMRVSRSWRDALVGTFPRYKEFDETKRTTAILKAETLIIHMLQIQRWKEANGLTMREIAQLHRWDLLRILRNA